MLRQALNTLALIAFVAATTNAFSQTACVDPDLSVLAVGQKIMLCDGSIAEGKYVEKQACTVSGQTDCISAGVYRAADLSKINAYDIRYGKTIGGVQGQLKLGACRNGVRNAVYNNNTTVGNAAGNQTGGADAFHWWDTVTNDGNGTFVTAMTGAGAAWGSDNFCDGSQITEVTNTKSNLMVGATPNCAATTCTDALPLSKIFYDPYTMLYITSVLVPSTGCGGAAECADWAEAVSICRNLDSGDGVDKWRLATQMELQLLSVGGIAFRNADFNNQLNSVMYSATNNSTSGTTVLIRTFNSEYDTSYNKTPGPYGAPMCVRSL